MFDEGRITDSQGHEIDCTNSVFIMTSNIGAGEMDFQAITADELRQMAEGFLASELVNRIDEVVGFRPLTTESRAVILDQILADRAAVFESAQGIALSVDDAVKVLILDETYDPRMGARPLQRAVEDKIVEPVVDAKFAGRIQSGDRVRAIADKIKVIIRREEI